jgi:hypothetical protein
MLRKTFGSWSRAERIAAVGVVVAVLAVGALVLNRSSSGPALAAGWTRIPIAPWSFTMKVDYQGSTDCNPIIQTIDDAAYYNAGANTRYVSLHVVNTGSGADPNLSDCGGRSGIGALFDQAGHLWSEPVELYPDGDGHWSTVDVAGAQHLTVGGIGDHGEKLTGPQLY